MGRSTTALREREFRLLDAGTYLRRLLRRRNAIGVRATLWGAAAIGVGVTLAVLLIHDVRTLERREVAMPTP